MTPTVYNESALRVSDSVTELLRTQPFYGTLALRLPLRVDPSRETLACDGHEIRYSPRWIADTDAHFIQTATARVVLACGLKHHTRRGERDPERWQRASQLVTHAMLRDAGFTLPPDADAWEDCTVEEAYERLQASDGGHSGEDDPSPPEAAPTPSASDSSGMGDDDADSDADAGADPSTAGDGPQQEDSAENPAEADGPASHDPSGTGEIMDASARSDPAGAGEPAPIDVVAEEQAWDEAMHQALNLAKSEGKVPGAVEEMLDSAHVSTLDWRALLRRYMTDTLRRDYTWSLPNRRFIDSGLYLPAMHCEAIGTLVVLLDVSGSVYHYLDTLERFWTEVREASSELGPDRIIVVQVDTRVTDAAEYSAEELPDALEAKGGGGTDFRPGFDWLDAQGIHPTVCLYFTDMRCSDYPDAEPPYPVVWCNWGPAPPHEWYREPWGERIDIA